MKYIYVSFGFIFMGLGALGVMLPVLPTTPFLLLALACFSRGSDRFNEWFKNTNLYKDNLEDFVQHKTMTLRNKIIIVSFASIMLLIPLIVVDIMWVKVFIVLLMLYKYYYFIFVIKTCSPAKISN